MFLGFLTFIVQDPQNNRIAQWLNVPTRMCIAELSFKLTSDPILGTYTILVENTPVQTFIVQEKGECLKLNRELITSNWVVVIM